MFQTKTYNGLSIVISPDILNKKWLIEDIHISENPFLIVFDVSGKIFNGSIFGGKWWRIENHHLIILDDNNDLKYTSIERENDRQILLYSLETQKTIKLSFDGFLDWEKLLENRKLEEKPQPHYRNPSHVQKITGGKIIRYKNTKSE